MGVFHKELIAFRIACSYRNCLFGNQLIDCTKGSTIATSDLGKGAYLVTILAVNQVSHFCASFEHSGFMGNLAIDRMSEKLFSIKQP